MEERKLDITKNLRLVRAADTGLVVDTPCAHGDAALYIALYTCRPADTDSEEQLDTLWPRCAFTELVGTVLADIRETEGEAGAKRFRDNIELAASSQGATEPQKRHCCEAGQRTGGREHTCGQSEATS